MPTLDLRRDYNLIVAGSVEERMLRLQQKKQQLAATLLDHWRRPQCGAFGTLCPIVLALRWEIPEFGRFFWLARGLQSHGSL